MTDRTAIKEKICATIESKDHGLGVKCEPYDGRFTGVDISQVSFKPPVCFVHCLGGPMFNWPGGKTVDEDGLFEIIVVGYATERAQTADRKDQTAAAIVDRLKLFIPEQYWGIDPEFINPPRLEDVKNLVSVKIKKQGLSFQRFWFRQAWRDGEAIDSGIDQRS